jgi:hypothetical protein
MRVSRLLLIPRLFGLGIGVSALALGALALWSGEMTEASGDGQTCTASNVAGSYGFSGSGTILTNPFGLPEGPVATVGVVRFDGKDRWITEQTLSLNGQIIEGASLTGTYTVNPDRTFTLTGDDGTSDFGVFVHDRDEGFFMGSATGSLITFTMKRVQKKA